MADLARIREQFQSPLRLGLWLDFRPKPGERANSELYQDFIDLAVHGERHGFSAVFTFQAMRVDRSKRAAILESQIGELIGSWREGKPLSDGRPLAPRPTQPGGPALMLGGDVDAALRRAARHADVFFGDSNFDYR